MNFEHYLDNNRPNPKRAALLVVAGAFAISGTSLMLTAGWVAGKMSIARVDPPSTEYILLSMNADEPMPPPPPPPPPAGSSVEDEVEPDPDDEVPEEPQPLEETQPEKPTRIPDAKPGGSPQGIPGGQIGGQIGGVIGGIPTGGGIGDLTRTIAVKPPSATNTVTKKPLAAVMARAVYSPDPDQKLLQQTKAARFDKRDGKSTVSFCIDGQGHVVDVKSKGKFPGDPQVDEILRRTISKWRFKPLEIGSKTVKTCTERTFSLRFQ